MLNNLQQCKNYSIFLYIAHNFFHTLQCNKCVRFCSTFKLTSLLFDYCVVAIMTKYAHSKKVFYMYVGVAFSFGGFLIPISYQLMLKRTGDNFTAWGWREALDLRWWLLNTTMSHPALEESTMFPKCVLYKNHWKIWLKIKV